MAFFLSADFKPLKSIDLFTTPCYHLSDRIRKAASAAGLKPFLFQVSTPEAAYDLRSDYGSPHC